jgi:hypothetical protein
MKRLVLSDFSAGIDFSQNTLHGENHCEEALGFLPFRNGVRSQWPSKKMKWVNEAAAIATLGDELIIFYNSGAISLLKLVLGDIQETVLRDETPEITFHVDIAGVIRWEVDVIEDGVVTGSEYLSGIVACESQKNEAEQSYERTVLVIPSASSDKVRYPNYYPALVDGEPATLRLPFCQVVTMWDDIPTFGNILWNKTSFLSLNISTSKPFTNYLWLSDPVSPGKIDPRYPVRAADEGAKIVGLHPVEEGLLVLTTRSDSGNQSGVMLLRGSAADYMQSGDNVSASGSLEVVAPIYMFDSLYRDTRASCYWNAQQSVLFVSNEGRLYQYRNGRVADITPPGLHENTVDFAEQMTMSNQGLSLLGGSVVADGPYAIFSHEPSGRVWVMQAVGETAAWTELSLEMLPLENGMIGD